MHGLTFIALSRSPASIKHWQQEERRRTNSADRHQRLTMVQKDTLADTEQQVLDDIAAQLSSSELGDSSKHCPECKRPFSIINVAEIELDCCRFCKGIWFDPSELQFFSGQIKEIPSDNLASRNSKYECPVCQALMTEFVFSSPSNLLVDRCPNGHGVYLEDRELERVFEII